MPQDDATAATEPRRERVSVEAGERLGRYELRRVLGSGGMGVVWAARDPDLDREVAIKLLRRAGDDAEPRARLLREARAMAKLKHPNVLVVHEVGSAGDRDYIAMELADGGSLDAWLATKPPRAEVIAALLAAGRGLAAAHAAGLVHRDFKPHNVLRSRDGRVLVTDFGLARGIATAEPAAPPSGDVALDQTLDAPSGDHVLGTPLTRTGAVVGTPAYMAPEQFAGATSDPRTDQFAFCVTAWQALAGERPFRGKTMDELRRAAESGVGRVQTDLPRTVRDVLARGLEPDPAKRWPDLATLLDELARATRPRRRWPYAVAGAACVLAGVAVFAWPHAPSQVPLSACRAAPFELAGAWPPGIREQLATTPAITQEFDRWGMRWAVSYERMCAEPSAPLFRTRLDCMLGLRDTAASMAAVASGEPEAFDPAMIPNLAVCEGASPVAPPAFPTDPVVRANVFAVIFELTSLRRYSREQLDLVIGRLEHEANDIGWRPLLGRVELAAAHVHINFDRARARAYYDQALAIATAEHDANAVAEADIGELEAAVTELEQPGWPSNTHAIDSFPDELLKLRRQAEGAVHAAGDNPVHVGALDLLEAAIEADHDHAAVRRNAFQRAIELATDARSQFESIGDLRRATRAVDTIVDYELRRNAPDSIDLARAAIASMKDELARAHRDVPGDLADREATVALASGDFETAHGIYDRFAARMHATGPLRTGKVVDASGTPVGGATVATWIGITAGDPLHAYRDERDLVDATTTAPDGAFTIHAEPGNAIVAEARAGRSLLQLVPAESSAIVVRIVPTTTVSGHAAASNPRQVEAFVRFQAGKPEWAIHAPLGADGSYSIGNVPPGVTGVGLVGPAGDGTRTIAPSRAPVWPFGVRIDVIVRLSFGEPDGVWILRGRVAPKTRADLEAAIVRSADVADAVVHPVGADASSAGRDLYQRGDLHAIVEGNADGEVTACTAIVDRVACKNLTAQVGKMIDNGDGTRVADTLAVLLEP